MILSRSFTQCSTMQCFELFTAVGEAASNVVAVGGHAMTIRVGKWCPNPDRAAAAQEPEIWVPGLGKDDSVDLELIVEDRLADLFSMGDPFYQAYWKLNTQAAWAPTTVREILGPKGLDAIPPLPAGEVGLLFQERDSDPFYTLRKRVVAMFGLILSRGGHEMALRVFRGEPIVERVQESRVVQGQKDGKPCERTETATVDRHILPIVLSFIRPESVTIEDVVSLRSHESTYDPCWSLASMLKGQYRAQKLEMEQAP